MTYQGSDDDDRRNADAGPPVEVPLESLSAEAITGIIEAFVLREGTDYGLNEASHETKVLQVRRQLESGEGKIVYDLSTESVTLVTAAQWARFGHEGR